ncbi:ARP8-like protein [Chaetomium sp. MPI-SDFR-AT-0129]|nr:ARP8-like protein [Chaetomium sp. MPI-SDFR-AT-0129]
MVGKVSDRVLLREGLERTDNGMKQTSWPDVPPINQKNYYTDYMKRDDQILSFRLQSEANRDRLVQTAKDRDRAMNVANANGEVPLPVEEVQGEDGPGPASTFEDPSKIIVIHPGSQNLRVGFASDALPKTIPMTLATQYPQTESEMHEALPRRQFEERSMDLQHGEEWSKKYQKMSNDLKIDMRANKRKVLPNSKDLVINFNRRIEPEIISQHNDPLQIEWTDITAPRDEESKKPPSEFIGQHALRVPDDSNPKFKLWWPIQHGWLNEDDYPTRAQLFNDLETLLDRTFRNELGLKKKSEWKQYSCVLIIPDLYDKRYVELLLHLCIELFEFGRVAFIQESMGATFGAGYTQACVVDVGAQKTSIACVEDGLCIEDSRINLKFGGFDVTETFIKMMLYDNFPYQDINLRRRYDFLLAEELKIKYCTLSQANISVQNFDFHLRVPNESTRKYQFKFYDEVILSAMGFYDPSIFDNSTKLRGRRRLIDRSYNAYDVDIPDDPASAAQLAILALIQPSVTETTTTSFAGAPGDMATPGKERSQPFNFLARNGDATGTPGTSKAPSPAPEGASTPVPAPYVFGSSSARDLNGGSPAPSTRNGGTPAPPNGTSQLPTTSFDGGLQPPQSQSQNPVPQIVQRSAKSLAIERDSVLPLAPLDIAIMTSIQNAAKGDEKKVRDLLGSIMVVGGGAKIPHFAPYLEEKLKMRRPDLTDRILVSRSAREMDEQVVVWKGASVFAKLATNDSWITGFEYKMLGARVVYNKVLWQY